ncbi:MAG TPA: S8 family serine peptidase, partial [Bacteroidia bacterium]
MIVCNSSGNSGGSAWPKINFPSDADSILTVGAVDASQNYANFSSIGPSADGRVKPDVMAQGVASVVANGSSSVGTSSGTSFSSPITAGMVACLWQSAPGKTNMEIIEAIRQSASLYATPNNQFGYGIPDYCSARSILVGLTEVAGSHSFIEFNSANPFDEFISFNLHPVNTSTIKIKIYNSLGQLVFSQDEVLAGGSNAKHTINTREMASGFYNFVIDSDNGTISYKLIKAGVK